MRKGARVLLPRLVRAFGSSCLARDAAGTAPSSFPSWLGAQASSRVATPLTKPLPGAAQRNGYAVPLLTPETEVTTLPNGVRIVSEASTVRRRARCAAAFAPAQRCVLARRLGPCRLALTTCCLSPAAGARVESGRIRQLWQHLRDGRHGRWAVAARASAGGGPGRRRGLPEQSQQRRYFCCSSSPSHSTYHRHRNSPPHTHHHHHYHHHKNKQARLRCSSAWPSRPPSTATRCG